MIDRGQPDERDPEQLLEFGVINLDKPPGPSAHQVTAWVRDSCDVERAAHAGTLDPKVTGCLPILTGTATRAAQVFSTSTKSYIAVLELHGPIPVDFEDTVHEFETEIYQKPPRKSAVARRLRTRTIHSLQALETQDRRALLEIVCESGTYIRKLCHDIGLALGVGAHMGDLRRIQTGSFDDTSLVTMEDVVDGVRFWRDCNDPTVLKQVVDPAERALQHLPRVTIAQNAAKQVATGANVFAPGILSWDLAGGTKGDLVCCYTPDDAAICLGTLVGDPADRQGTVVELERVLV